MFLKQWKYFRITILHLWRIFFHLFKKKKLKIETHILSWISWERKRNVSASIFPILMHMEFHILWKIILVQGQFYLNCKTTIRKETQKKVTLNRTSLYNRETVILAYTSLETCSIHSQSLLKDWIPEFRQGIETI